MVRLIDIDALDRAMYHKSFEVDDGRNVWNSGLWIRYKIYEEASREAPTVDAVPVVLIKEFLTRLIRRRKNLDDDCVDEAWNLKMQIEALEDLLNEWAWRKEE